MIHRLFPLTITILAGLIFPVNAAETSKPNIIFIFADDWGWQDLSCHDHPYIKTPNIDRLAKEGTDFHRFTVASGVCSPSRTAVMTGHFPARYGVNGHFAWVPDNQKRGMPDWVDPASPTLPRMLQDAGYKTGHFGKWHLSNNMIPDSPTPAEYGYDEYGAYNCSGEQMPYDNDVSRTIDFIKNAQDDNTPFFVNLWIHEPHTPFHVIPKYRQLFPNLKDEGDSIYAATLAYADKRIGELLDAIDELNLTENTLIIFSSDNGPARNPYGHAPKLHYDSATGAGFDTGAAKGSTGGRKGYKASLYEGGINVPFIARWPGKVKANHIDHDSLISAVDLLPTFCELAGAKLPIDYVPDGVTQTSTLTGKTSKTRRKPLFWKSDNRYPPQSIKPEHWTSYVVVFENWKLITSQDQKHSELYDITSDPLETNNLATSKPEVLRKLQNTLSQWIKTLPSNPEGNVFSKLRQNE